jgi:hypothetical protein
MRLLTGATFTTGRKQKEGVHILLAAYYYDTERMVQYLELVSIFENAASHAIILVV